MKRLPVVLMIGMVTSSFAQTRPKDVNGWGKITWGMTLDQTAGLYSDSKREQTEFWKFVIPKPVEVGRITMNVSIATKQGSDAVSQIRLWASMGLAGDKAEPQDYDVLKSLLVQKYGDFEQEERRVEYGHPLKVANWIFPSTTTTLKLDDMGRGLGTITIEYKAADKKALEAL